MTEQESQNEINERICRCLDLIEDVLSDLQNQIDDINAQLWPNKANKI